MERVLPTVAEISARYAARTIFTRFIAPATPEGTAVCALPSRSTSSRPLNYQNLRRPE
jgi:hypothetical protein